MGLKTELKRNVFKPGRLKRTDTGRMTDMRKKQGVGSRQLERSKNIIRASELTDLQWCFKQVNLTQMGTAYY